MQSLKLCEIVRFRWSRWGMSVYVLLLSLGRLIPPVPFLFYTDDCRLCCRYFVQLLLVFSGWHLLDLWTLTLLNMTSLSWLGVDQTVELMYMYMLLLQEFYLWFGYYRLDDLYLVFLLFLYKQLQLKIFCQFWIIFI